MRYQLTIKNRLKLGQLAQQAGLSATVRLTGNNPRTVRLWKERVTRGQTLKSPNAELSAVEIRRLLQAAPRTREVTLAQCRRRAGVDRSLATLSRLYRYSDLVMPEILLIQYKLQGTRKHLRVISIHYSIPRIVSTPGGTARRLTAKTGPFYTPRKNDYFLFHGEILAIDHPLFAPVIAPYLGPKDDTTAWFARQDRSSGIHPWHVIKKYRNDRPHTYCGRAFSSESGLLMGEAAAVRDSQHPLCRKCMPAVLARYQRNQDLKPRQEYQPDPPSVALAAWINALSRSKAR